MDLRPPFGPDAPGAAAAAVTGPLAHPFPLHPLAIALLRPLCGGDPFTAGLLLSLLAGLAAVVAAWRAGGLLFRGGGRAAGSLAATVPLLVLPSLLGGGDALALALAWWGVVLAWRAALDPELRPALLRAGLGGLLWGLSAWAKPVALPAGLGFLLLPVLGGRRAWRLFPALLPGALLALPLAAPLVHPQPELGLLGSWWFPPPGGLAGLLERPRLALSALFEVEAREPWALILPTALLALLGALARGPARRVRLALLLLAVAELLGVAAVLGERLEARYLASVLLPALLLGGFALLPLRLRLQHPGEPPLPPTFLEGLPLSLLLVLYTVATLRLFEGLALLREQEEGTGAPRGLVQGWVARDEGALPERVYRDASICGAVELRRWAEELARELPAGAHLLLVPLRDGRSWNLAAPLAVLRPELEVVELDERCCPGGPEACAEALPSALERSGGGALLVPLEPEGRCRTGAVDPAIEPWVQALRSLATERRLWYGILRAAPGSREGHPCELLGGEPPRPPATPRWLLAGG